MVHDAADWTARNLSAEDLPVLRSATISKATFCPSLSPVIPARSTALDVHEDILAAVTRLDETEAFLAVEPLHGSFRHIALLSDTCVLWPRVNAAGLFEIWRKVVSPTRMRGEAKSPAQARWQRYGAQQFRLQD